MTVCDLCQVHPALVVCSRCGKSACAFDSAFLGDALYCPSCHAPWIER